MRAMDAEAEKECHCRKIGISKWLVAFLFFLAFAKLLLVSGEEVIARNQPYDDLWQIMAAFRWYWLGSDYNHAMFAHLPVYSLWIALIHLTGVPLRIASELLYLVAGGLLVLTFLRAGFSQWLVLAIFAVVLFHPLSYTLFDYVLAETIYCSLFMMALSGLVMIWTRRDHLGVFVWKVATGFVCALLWNLRKENALLVVLIAVLAGLFLIESLNAGDGWKASFKKAAGQVVLPVLIIVLFSCGINSVNYFRFGLFVPTEFSSQGYKAAYRALLRIKPSHPIRFVPVNKETRQKAYEISPAFRELAWYFEGDPGSQAAAETRKHMNIQGEIAAGWFYWVFRDAVAASGHHRTAVEADAYYRLIADEINGAIDSGKLPGRRVLTTFLDPEFSNYLPYLYDSFKKIAKLFVATDVPVKPSDDPGIQLQVRQLFDQMANRRVALVPSPILSIKGWAFCEKILLNRVEVRTSSGELLASGSLAPRPDILNAYGGRWGGAVPMKTGFRMDVDAGSHDPKDLSLVFAGGKGVTKAIPFAGIKTDTPIEKLMDSAGVLVFALDGGKQGSPLRNMLAEMQRLIWSAYGRLVALFTWVGIGALVMLAIFWRRVDVKSPRFVAIVFLAIAVTSRVALFTLLDASSWPGNQPRYLFPVMPLYSLFLMLIIHEACQVINSANTNILKT